MKAIAFYKSGGKIGADWIFEVPEPKGENNPDVDGDEDIIIILHASQSSEGKDHTFDENKKYKCFEACIAALSEGKDNNENYKNHQKWLIKHKSHIKGVVLTSGDSTYDKRIISNAQSKLENDGIPVNFLSVLDITKLKNAEDLLKVINEQNFREIALQTLIALFPCCMPSQLESSTNAEINESKLRTGFSSFEDFVSHRLSERLLGKNDKWNASEYDKEVLQINKRLFENRNYTSRWGIYEDKVPHTLDKVIELLSKIAHSELEQAKKEEVWNNCLRALRTALAL